MIPSMASLATFPAIIVPPLIFNRRRTELLATIPDSSNVVGVDEPEVGAVGEAIDVNELLDLDLEIPPIRTDSTSFSVGEMLGSLLVGLAA